MPRILLAIVLWLAAAQAVVAHAALLDTAPAADAALAEPPGEVILRFNEPVSPVTVRLLDGAGAAVAEDAVARGAAVVLPIPPLGQGSYLLTWRVVSTDAHPIGGAFRFSVGRASVASDALELRDADWTAASAVHRAVYLSLLLLGAGSVVFLAVFQARTRRPPVLLRGSRLLLAAAALFALCLVPVQGALLLGRPVEFISIHDLLAAGATSPVARGGLASALLLLAAATLLGRAPAVAALSALGAVMTLGHSGHAATADPRWLMTPALALHAALAGLWAGALLPLRACVARLPAQEASALLHAFSRTAVPGVALLVSAGGILTLFQVGGPAGLATPYGAVLAFKLAGVAFLVGIALWNRNRLTPLLVARRPEAVRRLRLSVGLEIAVMLIVVASVAVLGHLPPPRALAAVDDAARHRQGAGNGNHASHGEPTKLDVAAQGLRMHAHLVPHEDGGYEIAARFEDAEGGLVEPLEVEVAFSLPELGVEPILRTMPREGDSYVLRTRDMSPPGDWRIDVVALISPFERVRFSAEAVIDP